MSSHPNRLAERPTIKNRHRLNPPRQSVALCNRPHLLAALNQARANRLSLVVAPAGYGKTTLLAQWAEHLRSKGTKNAWCSLSPRESSPTVFLRFIAQSLHLSGIDMSGTGLLETSQTSIDAAFASIIEQLEAVEGETVLIFDEFEVISDPATTELLCRLINALPHCIHVTIAARRCPHLTTLALNAHDNVYTLRIDDLQFTKDEVAELLADVHDCQDLSDIQNHTEGWPVAVQLYRLWAKSDGTLHVHSGDICPFNSVVDYLSEQVFKTLPDSLRNFLRQVQILDVIEPELADYVRGVTDSLSQLLDLQSVLPSFAEADTYDSTIRLRLHPLVAQAVRSHYQLPASEALELKRRASTWCLDQERYVDAVRYAVSTGDHAKISHVIKKIHPLHIFMREGISELQALVNELPPYIRENNRRIKLMLTFIHFKAGFFLEARAELDQMLVELNSEAGQQKADLQLKVEALALDMMIQSYMGSYDDQALEDLMDTFRTLTEGDPTMWTWRVNLLVVMHEQRGHFRQAREELQKCEAIYDAHGITWAGFHVSTHHVLINLAQGSLRKVSTGVKLISEKHRERFSSNSAILGVVRLVEAAANYERGQIEGIETAVYQALELLGESEGWFEHRSIAIYILAECKYRQGGVAAVENLVREWESWANARGIVYFRRILPALLVRYLSLSGRLTEATEIRSQALPETFEMAEWQPRMWRETDIIAAALTHYFIASEDLETAERCASKLLDDGIATERLRTQISSLIFLAIVTHKKGATTDAETHMIDAVRIACPEGFVAPFVESGQSVIQLLQSIHTSPMLSKYEYQHVELILKCASRTDGTNPLDLTPKEVEVLRSLSENASNKLIARQLGISENTVKFHLKRIFSKLGVTSRRAAASVFIARMPASTRSRHNFN